MSVTEPDLDARRSAPATLKNRGPIGDLLLPLLPRAGTVLEIASGTGEHVVHFARRAPHLLFQPSDPSPAARASIAAWTAAEGLANVRAPLALDAAGEEWPVGKVDAVVCINMIHISPWEATVGLMRGAGARLPADGILFTYGAYVRDGVETAPSNVAFDADLRRQDPRFGLRHLAEVTGEAAKHGLALARVEEMPANNLSLVFRKVATVSPRGVPVP
ncbi:class I SAM-dependent methyltransferase [Xanthobacter aminoxidans]|nr:class I SAM-dependent methyltransferase [Xanthobacter aminoxidans]